MSHPYVYFIHYTRGDGTGSTPISLTQPITSWDDIQAVTDFLRTQGRQRTAVVANYQLLSGPDTCRTCGR